MVETAIILAGGLGTRLRSLVNDRPKPMAMVKDTPFLAILINYWIKQGVNKIIMSVGYKNEVIQSYFGSEFNGCKIKYSIESSPLGTGGAFIQAASFLNNQENFLLMNGDTYFEITMKDMEHYSNSKNADWLIALTKSKDKLRYGGVCIDQTNRIQFENSSYKTDLVNGGVYLINPRILKKIEKIKIKKPMSLEGEIFPRLSNVGVSVFGAYFSNKFIDIGIPEDYKRAAQIIYSNR